jgi:hypothetical protein
LHLASCIFIYFLRHPLPPRPATSFLPLASEDPETELIISRFKSLCLVYSNPANLRRDLLKKGDLMRLLRSHGSSGWVGWWSPGAGDPRSHGVGSRVQPQSLTIKMHPVLHSTI